MQHHNARRRVECHARRAHRLCVGAAILTATVLSNAAGTAPAMQQVQPAFGATTESAAPRPLALPPPAPAGLARPATAVDLKPPHAALPSASNSIGKGALETKADKSGKKLFEMADSERLVVDGKQTTAGEVKKSVLAEIAKKDGPPRTVKGGTRTLDLAALNAAHAGTTVVPTLSTRTLNAPLDPGTQVNITPEPSTKGTFAQSTNHRGALIKEIRCTDKGPPAISEIRGKIKAGGGAFTLSGRCFGDRAGSVDVAGLFGQVRAAVVAWDMNEIKVQLPAGIRGVVDHTANVTVATSEARRSTPMRAEFVAQRERIEVPARLWSPVYYFESRVESATYFDDKYGPPKVMPPNGRSGQAGFALKVNKSCALDTMDAVVQLGNVSQITGWEAGPPDSAAATATWEASCRETRVKKTQGLLGEVSWTTGSTVCVVSFHPRAMAYCPVGISPDPVSLKAQGAPPRLR